MHRAPTNYLLRADTRSAPTYFIHYYFIHAIRIRLLSSFFFFSHSTLNAVRYFTLFHLTPSEVSSRSIPFFFNLSLILSDSTQFFSFLASSLSSINFPISCSKLSS